MLQSRVFFMLLATSTALTIFSASMVSSSMGVSLLSILPRLCTRNPNYYHLNTTMEDGEDPKMDYNDVDYLSNELEHQIIQLLGNEKDSVHKMEDIYPGRTGRQGSYDKYMQPEKKTPYLRYKHYSNQCWETIINKMELLTLNSYQGVSKEAHTECVDMCTASKGSQLTWCNTHRAGIGTWCSCR